MAKKKQDKDKVKDRGIRLLTAGEIQLAQSIFASTIDYAAVWILRDSFLSFNLQNEDTAMSLKAELCFRNQYRDDFSCSTYDLQHLFIHEMSHVWQRAKGINVTGRGLVSWLISYRYTLDGRILSEYPLEQQAQIIADNFTLQAHGYKTWIILRRSNDITLDGDISESAIRQQYKVALRGFPW